MGEGFLLGRADFKINTFLPLTTNAEIDISY